jgi:hypothetical protein
MKKIVLVLFFFNLIFNAFSQEDVKFTKSNFPDKPGELATAKKQIQTADILAFNEKKYDEALKYL